MGETESHASRQLLTTGKAARYLGCQPGTLRQKRLRGDGPPFHKFGDGPGARCLYDQAELDRWLADRTYRSTADQAVKTSELAGAPGAAIAARVGR
jgi:hypothetical protein